MAIALSLAALDKLDKVVSTPAYRREDLSPGIVHIGVGNFHRAHMAVYLHRLFENGGDRDWAIVGAGITDFDRSMRDRLARQDWLTTVVELDPALLSASIIGSMIDFVAVNPAALIDALAQPHIRIVSLTVTEGGYFIDAQTGGFNALHPDVLADMQATDSPGTVFGILIAALVRRRAAHVPPFTVMSCDNLPENGRVARQTVLGMASAWSAETRDWIAANVAFPGSMVDCITPATSDRERAIVRDQFAIEDAAPVVCEPFRQWVLEDHFSNGRPALENVGVQFVADVAAYELMKLRILNGGHASIAYPAALLDIHYVHEAMRHPLVAGFLNKLVREEIIPTVPGITGVSFDDYYGKVVERFSNQAVGDTIPRLCLDGANRQPKFILPSVEARLAAGQSISGLALVSALWCRYCYGTTDAGTVIAPNDPQWDRLTAQAGLARENPRVWLQMADIYGALASQEDFAQAFEQSLNTIWKKGAAATLQAYL